MNRNRPANWSAMSAREQRDWEKAQPELPKHSGKEMATADASVLRAQAIMIRSQEEKLAWAAEIKAVALKLQDVAMDCPHGHARRNFCNRCRTLHAIADLIHAEFAVEVDAINREYLVPDLVKSVTG